MPRLLFEKTGNAVWISHLDLMRLFQRAFKRAGLPLTHTQGFNPRPSVSIALPLSVGVASKCELLDFELAVDGISCEDIKNKLTPALIEGVRVIDVYDTGRKVRDLTLLSCKIDLHYDNGIPECGLDKIRELFKREEVLVPKKTKSGVQDQNIITMIRRMHIDSIGEKVLRISSLICCQNPTLNPAQIPLAIEKYLPDLKPDHTAFCRMEIFDSNETIFR